MSSISARIQVDGKFFRVGNRKIYLKGITYGPFAPNASGEFFPSPERAREDFALIQELGANLLRLYYVPPRWFLDLAAETGLYLLIDIPWNKHLCFLDSPEIREDALRMVREAALHCGNHSAVFAFSVVNEIAADIVRWSGAPAVGEFIEELIETVKAIAPECLCTFGNYPPTEYLRAQNIDFFCFNVYLHHQRPFENYLGRLQMIADSKPLMLGEFGIDCIREGEDCQRDILSWQIESSFRNGLAGTIIYSFTDDWYRDGRQITDWAFGLTTTDRQRKPAFQKVQQLFNEAPYFPLSPTPKVSVVVASYNGERTLHACLRSLERLNYPDYEVILVDDGSTDHTIDIAARYPWARYIRHEKNRGLSAARNSGIAAATGEIVAFTDSDCRADEDWLYYLVQDLIASRFAGIGGHNLLPPEDSWIAASVMVSPGGPAHVMLTDRLAEHIPGCNMAFYKWALDEIGGFDPLFRKAGDDVDVCWRLQQQGYKIGFSPAGFVWHYRRSTVRDYLKQQGGYGEAEALLVHRHPEYFNWFGGSEWQGRIYSPAKFGVLTRGSRIYHGWFGTAFFQTLYTPPPSFALMLLTSFEYHILITLPLLVLSSVVRPLFPTAIGSLLVSLGVCAAAAWQADIPRNKKTFWSRPLVALLFFLQPIVRGWARYRGSLQVPKSKLSSRENLASATRYSSDQSFNEVEFWNDRGVDRLDFLSMVVERLDHRGWQNKVDTGWNRFDVEVYGSAWTHVQLTTVSEALGQGKQLLRCRLKPAWTLFARVTFLAILAAELLVIGVAGEHLWWLSLMLLSLPLMILFMAREQRDLQRIVTVFLDEVAAEMKLKRVEPEPVSSAALEIPVQNAAR
ncbi:MAG: glycosyltransferase [Verrucomicrobiota bacterium]|nr:glycosyltransferase [Verrucomicrobiota bacterium]